jgi:hypothetical protein
VLIAGGILWLCLSGVVMRTGSWWQGTLQALGVGFVVGGIVDVLAISGMNQYSTATQRHWNDEALKVISYTRGGAMPDYTYLGGAFYDEWAPLRRGRF